MISLKKSFNNFGIYFISEVISKSASLLTLPYITIGLPVEKYGEYVLLITLVPIMALLSFSGNDALYARIMYRKTQSHPRRLFFIKKDLSRQALVSVFFGVGLIFLLGTDLIVVMQVIVLSSLSILITYPRTDFIVSAESRKILISSLIQSTIVVLGVYFLVQYSSISIKYLLSILIFANLMVALYFFSVSGNQNRIVLSELNYQDKIYKRDLYGASLLNFFGTYADRFILSSLNVTSFGVYALASSIALVAKSFFSNVMMALQPEIMKYLEARKGKKQIILRLYILLLGVLLLILPPLFYTIDVVVTNFFDERYEAASFALKGLIVIQTLDFVYHLTSVSFLHAYKSVIIRNIEIIYLAAVILVLPVAATFGGLEGFLMAWITLSAVRVLYSFRRVT